MTPVPLELPLKAGEAAALAGVIFEYAESRPLTADVRSRLAGRFTQLRLPGLRPYFPSLQRDPVHPSTYYIAADAGAPGETSRYLLLHMALASAPSSALFPHAVLIGRIRPDGGSETVVNAIPFGPGDGPAIRTFAEKVDRDFLPRPRGAQSSLTIRTRTPETVLPAAFQACRTIQKSREIGFPAVEGAYEAALWAAIRAGWRQGFAAASETIALSSGFAGLESARAAVDAAPGATRYSVQADAGQLDEVERIYSYILKLKSAADSWRNFDFELVLGRVTPDALHTALAHLKSRGCPAQLAEVDAGVDAIEDLASAAREANAILSLRWNRGVTDADLGRIGKATHGRLNYKITEEIDRHEEIPADLCRLAECLGG